MLQRPVTNQVLYDVYGQTNNTNTNIRKWRHAVKAQFAKPRDVNVDWMQSFHSCVELLQFSIRGKRLIGRRR